MNILLINWMDIGNPSSGGAEVHLQEIFSRIAYKEKVTLLCSGWDGCDPENIQNGIRILRTGSRPTFNWNVPFYYKRHLAKEKFDIIVEGINKVPFFTLLFTGKTPFVIIPHLFGPDIFKETNIILGSYVYLMERPIPFVYRNSTFEVISESTRENLIMRGISPEKIHVIYCGMDHNTYFLDESVKKFDKPTVLFVGRLKRYKGVDILIRTMAHVIKNVPDAELVIIGSGDYESRLRKLAATCGVEKHCRFEGYLPTEKKVDFMRRSHLIVNPSPREGWGLNNIEANACGTAVVASDAPGLRDSVRAGETGLLFPYGDEHALTKNIIQILSDDKLRTHLEQGAVKWALRFQWDEAAEQTHRLLKEFLITR